MRRIGVTAATVVLVLAFGALAVRAANGPSGPISHSCTAKDQSFIQSATIDVTGLAALADEFRSGSAKPGEVAGQAFDAAERVTHVKPDDPSLRAAQKYLGGMFSEYATAVVTIGKGKDGSARMQRAYGLANGARDVLAAAQPALLKNGCDVGPLL